MIQIQIYEDICLDTRDKLPYNMKGQPIIKLLYVLESIISYD